MKNNDGNCIDLYGDKHSYTRQQSAYRILIPAGSMTSTNLPDRYSLCAVAAANSSNAGYVDSTAAEQDNAVSDIVVSTSRLPG